MDFKKIENGICKGGLQMANAVQCTSAFHGANGYFSLEPRQ